MSIRPTAFFLLLTAIVSVYASEPPEVSLIQLIANPKSFHGKKVQVIGFMHLEFESNGLYLHKEDFKRGIGRNAIWISIPDYQYKVALRKNDNYIRVVGTFDAYANGHLGLWSSSIGRIEQLEVWGEYEPIPVDPPNLPLNPDPAAGGRVPTPR